MAVAADTGNVADLPNFVGELFQVSRTDTPLLSMIGGLTGGIPTDTIQFTWQTNDLPTASQDTQLEGDDPTASHRTRDDILNVVQIHQEAVRISYSKLANIAELSADNANLKSSTSIIGNQPVSNELDHQLRLKMLKVARDVEFSFLQGVFSNDADATTTARQTRGMENAISTNAVAAGSTDLSRDHLQELFRTMVDNDAPLVQPVIFANSLQKQRITDIYAYAPESRNVGGVNIKMIETDFAEMGVVYDRHMPTDDIYILDVAFMKPRFLSIPGKGHFFMEPLARTGAQVRAQLYGEIGLEYGPETYHGAVTGLTTS